MKSAKDVYVVERVDRRTNEIRVEYVFLNAGEAQEACKSLQKHVSVSPDILCYIYEEITLIY